MDPSTSSHQQRSSQSQDDGSALWHCVCSDDVVVPVNVTEIAEYSGYFAAMLHSQMRETFDKEIDLRLISSETLHLLLEILFLEHMPSGKEEIETSLQQETTLTVLEEILKATDYLDITSVYPKVSCILRSMVQTECKDIIRLWQLWQNCLLFQLDDVKTDIAAFVSKRLTQFKKDDAMFVNELPVDLLEGIIKSPDVDIRSEVDLIWMINDWVDYSPETRIKFLDKLFDSLHVPSLFHTDQKEILPILEQVLRASPKKIEPKVKLRSLFSSYAANPPLFLDSNPHMKMIRNGKEIVLFISGEMEDRPATTNGNARRRWSCAAPRFLSCCAMEDINRLCQKTPPATLRLPHSKAPLLSPPPCAQPVPGPSHSSQCQQNTKDISSLTDTGSKSNGKGKRSSKRTCTVRKSSKSVEVPPKILCDSCRCSCQSEGPRTKMSTSAEQEVRKFTASTEELKVKPSSLSPQAMSSDDSCLKMKTLRKLKAQIKLVEFGVASIDNFVYVVGGQRKSHDAAKFSIKGCYRLDPHIGEWNLISSMSTARCLLYLGAVWGQLYAVGGANVLGILRTTEYYVPVEDQWYPGVDLPTPLHEHAGCVYDGKLYVSGGHTDTDHTASLLCLTSKEADRWQVMSPMATARSYHIMAAVGTSIYVIGGCGMVDGHVADLLSCEMYSPVTDQWTELLDLNTPVTTCLPVVSNGQILCIGSYSFSFGQFLNQCVIVDPADKSWKIVPLECKPGQQVNNFASVSVKLARWLVK